MVRRARRWGCCPVNGVLAGDPPVAPLGRAICGGIGNSLELHRELHLLAHQTYGQHIRRRLDGDVLRRDDLHVLH